MVNKVVSNLSIFITFTILASCFYTIPGLNSLRPSIPFGLINGIDVHSPEYRIDLHLLNRDGKDVFNDNFFAFNKKSFFTHSSKITFYYAVILLQFSRRPELVDIAKRYICTDDVSVAQAQIDYRYNNTEQRVNIVCD